MLIHPKTGAKLVTSDEACEIYGCGKSNLRMLAQSGELRRVQQGKRMFLYYLDEVEKIAKRKAATRKKRGGRPRRGTDAA